MTDPRDRLYAFFDTSTIEESQISIDPRYGDTIQEVYHNFAVQYVRSTKDLKILDHVVHDARSLQSDMPAWVPSWDHMESGPQRSSRFSKLTSREYSFDEPSFVEANLLKVRGVILGCVQFVTTEFEGPATTIETLARTWTAVGSLGMDRPYDISKELQTFFSALTEATAQGDSTLWARQTAQHITHMKTGFELHDKHIQAMVEDIAHRIPSFVKDTVVLKPGLVASCVHRYFKNKALADAPVAADRIHQYVQSYVHRKKFFVTERGYMGLGPAVPEEGDIYAIIFGSMRPCILRRTQQKDRWKFLGPCFILGARPFSTKDGRRKYSAMLGSEPSKEWERWDVEEQDIYLC
ncbi:hypothetical protein E8E12_009553 [Didymella heteroderae]|uniref:Uncharacterized protein n=1 Tax=Didymella heteroderae TaxID=1769908 RepID=A0A9P4WUG6_9PLEO|nr:hypothetical protein E8E12_009553 [Didymella heteroderae]